VVKLNRIAELREEKNVTQAQLAEAIGVSQAALSRWESETNILDVISASAIADFFGVTLDYVTGRSPYRLSVQIAPRESELLNLFRSFSQEKRETIYQLIKALTRQK
jgi:transcriptional regulator with XRE-family HTH domain